MTTTDLPTTLCASCTLGAHNCVDLIHHPTLGLVACCCQPCTDDYNRAFWAAVSAA